MTTPAAPTTTAPAEATLKPLDPDLAVPPLDTKEFPPLTPTEVQATNYARGHEKAELISRENLHAAHGRLGRLTGRMAELKAAMGTGISPEDLRYEAFTENRPASRALTFDEIERLNRIRGIRQANHELQQLREKAGNLKSVLPHYEAEVRRARAEILKEAEREAARKKLAANHLGPKW